MTKIQYELISLVYQLYHSIRSQYKLNDIIMFPASALSKSDMGFELRSAAVPGPVFVIDKWELVGNVITQTVKSFHFSHPIMRPAHLDSSSI